MVFEPAWFVFLCVHLAGIALLLAMLIVRRWRSFFERHCLGRANAQDVGFIRIVTCATLALYVLSEALPSYALLDSSLLHPMGYFEPPAPLFSWFLASSLRLRCIGWVTLALLVLGAVGWRPRLTLPLAAAVYLFFAALLRTPGKAFHEGYLAWYVLLVLALLPANNALRLDAWLGRRKAAPTPSTLAESGAATPDHAWSVWACQAAAVVPYLQLSLSKWWAGGPFWFDGRSMRNYMLTDDLNLTQWNIDLALRWYQAPTLAFTLVGLFGLLVESFYPLVLLVPGLRVVLPAAVMLLHLGVWFGQDALFLDAILIPAIFFMPSRWRKTQA